MNSNLITEVVLPEGLEMIGGAAFAHIKALKTITLPDSLLILNTECFIDTGLTGIVIPPHVRFIGGSAFSGCQALRSLSFAGNELKTIEAYAFFDTRLQMETLKIPNSVTSVGIYAFTSGAFKTLILSSGMTEIPQGCFIGGTWLQTLRIPASIKSIGEYAFDGKLGEQITQVYFDGTESEWAQVSIGAFNDQLRTMKVHCKAEPYVDPFLDVLEKEYYAEPVRWAVNHDPQITNGTGANTFSPEATCTRGQVVTFLWRANGSPEPKSASNPFVDVKTDDYFYKAVLWAVEQGITNGMDSRTSARSSPAPARMSSRSSGARMKSPPPERAIRSRTSPPVHITPTRCSGPWRTRSRTAWTRRTLARTAPASAARSSRSCTAISRNKKKELSEKGGDEPCWKACFTSCCI